MLAGMFARRVAAAPAFAPTMLDPLNKGTNVVLSNSNLTATKAAGGIGWQMARSVLGVTTGKYYCEATWDEFSGSFTGIGIGDQDAAVSNFYGSDNNGLIYINTGDVYKNSTISTTIQSSAEGNVSGIAFDADAKLIWFRTSGGNWNNNGSADPATGVGGIAFSPSMSGTYYVGLGVQTSPSDQMSINFGPTFAGTPPAGFGMIGEVGPPAITAPRAITVSA